MVGGLQVPEMAGVLVELAGRAGAAEFWHRGPIWVNVGTIFVSTVMVMEAVVAHCPGSGVKL